MTREKPYGAIRKVAESRKVQNAVGDAYWEGFSKAAEAYGVDPQALMKVADRMQDSIYGRALGGAAAGGLIGSVLSDMTGDGKRSRADKIKHALLSALAGGAIGYSSAAPHGVIQLN